MNNEQIKENVNDNIKKLETIRYQSKDGYTDLILLVQHIFSVIQSKRIHIRQTGNEK